MRILQVARQFYPKVGGIESCVLNLSRGLVARGHHVEVGLGELRTANVDRLSFGQGRLLEIARALAGAPKLILFDEPAAGLNAAEVEFLLQKLTHIRDKGATVIVIEHNMDVIKVGDHIIDLGPEGGDGGGKVLFEGTPEELIKNKESYTAEFLIKEL